MDEGKSIQTNLHKNVVWRPRCVGTLEKGMCLWTIDQRIRGNETGEDNEDEAEAGGRFRDLLFGFFVLFVDNFRKFSHAGNNPFRDFEEGLDSACFMERKEQTGIQPSFWSTF